MDLIEEEIWKDIPNYEGYYKCSNYGNIKSLKRIVYGNQKGINSNIYETKERLLKYSITNKGYKKVTLSVNNKIKSFSIHYLVAITFLGYVKNSRSIVINHKDKNKLNNHNSNLEICSNRYNVFSAINKSKTTSKYTGVYYDHIKAKENTRNYRASIHHNKKRVYIGSYFTEEEAYEAYLNYIKNHNLKLK